jgi:hypothetical protein
VITPDDGFVVYPEPPPPALPGTAPVVSAGSSWEGVGQKSWWLTLYLSEDGTRWRALCLKAPDHYPWVQPGEERWLPAGMFGDMLVPL